ncbi:MAG: hypothetical protein QM479_04335, partial [Pseudomonadota bacterium]
VTNTSVTNTSVSTTTQAIISNTIASPSSVVSAPQTNTIASAAVFSPVVVSVDFVRTELCLVQVFR